MNQRGAFVAVNKTMVTGKRFNKGGGLLLDGTIITVVWSCDRRLKSVVMKNARSPSKH